MGLGCEPKELDSASLSNNRVKNQHAFPSFVKQAALEDQGRVSHFVSQDTLAGVSVADLFLRTILPFIWGPLSTKHSPYHFVALCSIWQHPLCESYFKCNKTTPQGHSKIGETHRRL